MKNTSVVSTSVRRTVLLMLAGASVGLMLTDTMTRVQGAFAAVAAVRATYEPCVRAKMTGDWMCGHVVPAVKVTTKAPECRKVL